MTRQKLNVLSIFISYRDSESFDLHAQCRPLNLRVYPKRPEIVSLGIGPYLERDLGPHGKPTSKLPPPETGQKVGPSRHLPQKGPVRPDTFDCKRLFIFDADKHYIELFGRADIIPLFLAVVNHPHPAED